jgi:hypothetical protein
LLRNLTLNFDVRRAVAILARGVAILIALAVVSLALYLIVRGAEITSVPEAPLVSTQGSARELFELLPTSYFRIYWPAVVYLLGGLGIVLGLTRHEFLPAAWISWILLSIWSVLYLFSSGTALLPLDLGLMVCLILLTIAWKPGEQESEANLLDGSSSSGP